MGTRRNLVAKETLGETVRRTLVALLDTMIPADPDLGLPGAGDDAIAESVVQSIRASSMRTIIDGLTFIDELSKAMNRCRFDELDPDVREEFFFKQKLDLRDSVRVLGSIAVHSYYCDSRVMNSLGMEARAPFPEGFTVEEGDLSLLEPVKARGKIYRDA